MGILQISRGLISGIPASDSRRNKNIFTNRRSDYKLSRPSYSQFGKRVFFGISTSGQMESFPAERKFVFPINPEEFNFDRQERVQVVQTYGEPFIDDFGVGLPTLQIRGTTGWHTRPGNANWDGKAAFDYLYQKIIQSYHSMRKDYFDSGKDPDLIQMFIFNEVDNVAYRIVPISFHYLRSKSRPLLYQYDLNFRVTADLNFPEPNASADSLSNHIGWQSAFVKRSQEKLSPGMTWLSEKIIQPTSGIYKGFLEPVMISTKNFLDRSALLFADIKLGAGVAANAVYTVAVAVDTALRTVRNTVDFIEGMPLDMNIALNHLQSTWSDVECYLSKGIKENWLADFQPLMGISNCAATLGVEDGRIAGSSTNGVEWAVNLKEIARNAEAGNLISWRSLDENGTEITAGSNTPVVVNDNLDEKIATLRTTAEIASIFAGIVEVIESVALNPENVATDTDGQFSDVTKIRRIREVTVTDGQTLQDIALQQFGDPERWRDIMAFNDIVVETPEAVYFPTATFTFPGSLLPGEPTLDFGSPVPSAYADPGARLRLVDANGKEQTLTVKSRVGTVITFYETFSRFFTGPVKITRFDNRASVGQAGGQTTLASDWATGSKEFYVTDARDIYLGFRLYLQGPAGAQFYTVTDVSYIEKLVKVDKTAAGFSAGTTVEIFDTESGLVHLQPGLVIKIPISGLDNNPSQTSEEVFGVDVGLTNVGKFLIEKGDLGLRSGLDNLEQAVRHRIHCPFTSIITHPTYGCGISEIIGDKISTRSVTLAKAMIIEALNNEPRLETIRDFEMVVTGDAIGFSIKVQTVGENSSSDLNFVLEG